NLFGGLHLPHHGARAGLPAAGPVGTLRVATVEHTRDAATAGRGQAAGEWLRRVPTAYWVVGVILVLLPAVSGEFVLFQIFGWSFILGMIALSLMFLAGYGGMVSLAQMTVAAVGGYLVAILGTSGVQAISLGWPWWLYVP